MECKVSIRSFLVAFIGVVLMIFSVVMARPANAGIVFIVNKTVAVDTLSKTDIKKIFLGKKITWENESEVKFVVLDLPAVHDIFTKEYTRKTPSQFGRYWKKQVFTGKGSAPKSFNTEKEVIDFVANMEGAIGYVSSSVQADGVKIPTITD